MRPTYFQLLLLEASPQVHPALLAPYLLQLVPYFLQRALPFMVRRSAHQRRLQPQAVGLRCR